MHINFIGEDLTIEGGACQCCQQDYLLSGDMLIESAGSEAWADKEDAETLVFEYLYRMQTQVDRAQKMLDFLTDRKASQTIAKDHSE